MSLDATAAWNRARAFKLHEHFTTAAAAVQAGARIGAELQRVQRLVDGLLIQYPGGELRLEISAASLRREWDYWLAGGRKGRERAEHVRQPEALLCTYTAGCGGATAMPRALIAELHRRLTLATGGRDKHGKSPISVVFQQFRQDFAARRPLPGIDYDAYPAGAEFPWSYSTVCRHKPPRTLRALGNRGAAAHKAIGAHVSLNYARLRKGELYTLDDVRLDIVCIDEATGEAIEVVLYVFMEVGSRAIVAYVMKPAAAIQQEDVDELVAHALQVPGFGLGIDYLTHILFERGATACSDGAKAVLEGVTGGRIKVHKTGMIGGVRWLGGPRDKARGNAAGKAVIESFNRWLHYALLHLPGQRGNHADNQPASMGDLGQARYHTSTGQRTMKGTLIDQAEQLAQFQVLTGQRVKLKLPMLYLFELNEAVREAIKRHNTEAGHDYRGHGEHFEAEVAPGVWQPTNLSGGSAATLTTPTQPGNGRDVAHASIKAPAGVQPDAGVTPRSAPSSTRTYTLHGAPLAGAAIGAREVGIYWAAWSALAKVRPDLDRHAVTHRVLGANVPHKRLTRPQWAQLLKAFRAITHEARTSRS